MVESQAQELLRRMEQLRPGLPERLRGLVQSCGPAWLVGGCIRDLMLNRPPKDTDLAAKDPQAWAQALGKRVVVLDPQRGHLRALGPGLPPDGVDIAPLRQPSIQEDLRARDLTINALALDLQSETLLDPCRGAEDLRQHCIRSCSVQAFPDDPLRALRAHRLAASLAFDLDAATATQALAEFPLTSVSPERIRKEWLALLSVHDAPQWLANHPELFGIVPGRALDPEGRTAWDHACAVMQGLSDPQSGRHIHQWWTGLAGPSKIAPARHAILHALLAAADHPFELDRLSRKELKLCTLTADCMPDARAWTPGQGVESLAIAARLLDRGPLPCLLALACCSNSPDLETSLTSLEALCAQAPSAPRRGTPAPGHPWDPPKPFLTGHDLLSVLQSPKLLKPLLRASYYLQWAGQLQDRDQALAWAKAQIYGNGRLSPVVYSTAGMLPEDSHHGQ